MPDFWTNCMNTPEVIERFFKRRVEKKIVQVVTQSTQIAGNPDYPDHPAKWLLSTSMTAHLSESVLL